MRTSAPSRAKLGPHGIRVNSLMPGSTETAMLTQDVPLFGTEAEEAMRAGIPLGRGAQPAEIADVAVLLASELARYVTGTSVRVDGGVMRI